MATKEEEEQHAEKERVGAVEKQALECERQLMEPYIDKAATFMPAIENSKLKLIHEEMGYVKFVLGGSWVSETGL